MKGKNMDVLIFIQNNWFLWILSTIFSMLGLVLLDSYKVNKKYGITDLDLRKLFLVLLKIILFTSGFFVICSTIIKITNIFISI